MTWGETLVTATEAAELAQRGPATIRQWVRRGWLQAVPQRRGRARLYRARDVLEVERDARRRQRDTRFKTSGLQ